MGACMCEGVCLLLGLSKPSWHWVPVVHHARSLAAGHKAVGASPTCAWRNDPAASWGSCGVAMHGTPLHVLAAMWGIAGGPPSVACLDEDTEAHVYIGVAGLPRQAPGYMR